MLEPLPTECQGLASGRGAFRYLEASLSADDSTCGASTVKSKAGSRFTNWRASGDRQIRTRVMIAHESPIVAAGLQATFAGMQGVASVAVSLHPLNEIPSSELFERVVIFADYRSSISMAHAIGPDERCNVALACVTDRDKEVEIRGALGCGISGYLLADCSLDEYAECLKVLSAGAQFVCDGASKRLVERQQLSALTPRELNVLRLVIDGQSNQAIGQELQLALGTIKAHVRAILTKLGAKSRTQAACLAAERGIYGAAMAA